MIIHSVTPQEYILPAKNKKRVLFTSERDSKKEEAFMRVKNGVPCYCRRRDDEEDIIFSTDPKEYL